MYHPQENNYSGDKIEVEIEKVQIQTADNISLLGWFHEKDLKKFKTVVYFHGNAGSLENRIHKLNHFKNMDVNFLIIAWRGFSGNLGKPSENALYEDGKSAINWLKNKGLSDSDLIIYGESLGTGIATEVSQNKKYAGLILETPFTSMIAAAKNFYPYIPVSLILKDKYKNDIMIMHNNFTAYKENLKREEEPFSNYLKKEVEVKRNGFQAHCMLGVESYGINHPKKTAMILLNNILGGPGMNSRLNLAIREKYGFTYSIESNYTPYSDTGIFSIYLASDNDKINKSIKLTKKELVKFCQIPLGTLQLKKAKQQLIGQIAIGQESEVNLMLAMGKSMLLYNKVDTFESVKNKIEAISSNQLLEVANEVFNLDNLSCLIYKV